MKVQIEIKGEKAYIAWVNKIPEAMHIVRSVEEAPEFSETYARTLKAKYAHLKARLIKGKKNERIRSL